ncbi:HIT domain-containing protein [Paenibacillus amylolyticus]|uniref:HIT domain-containing protein n=1 Tax=Paenibacillus amylolyticus TaxID=1451 RepID=UPI0032425836
MTQDFYCDEVLSGKTQVKVVMETNNVMAYHHTRPYYKHHIVVIPKIHIQSFISEEEENDDELV